MLLDILLSIGVVILYLAILVVWFAGISIPKALCTWSVNQNHPFWEALSFGVYMVSGLIWSAGGLFVLMAGGVVTGNIVFILMGWQL